MPECDCDLCDSADCSCLCHATEADLSAMEGDRRYQQYKEEGWPSPF